MSAICLTNDSSGDVSMHRSFLCFLKTLLAACCSLLALFPAVALAATVTLAWIENDPDAQSYRLFQRTDGEVFDYADWIYSGSNTSFTVNNLENGVTYFFVVRAYNAQTESSDSNEIEFTVGGSDPSSGSGDGTTIDTDGDGVVDELDAFPSDPDEWGDADGDGTGNNADLDDDNDGMPDSWEIDHGLNPLRDDSQEDFDGDGVSNIDEYENQGNPSQAPGNQAPFAPELYEPYDTAAVGLTPSLTTRNYIDPDGDLHARTRFQIATNADFSMPSLDQIVTGSRLTSLDVPELILDADTTYFWRVRYIDCRNGQSDWSPARSFTTHAAVDSIDSDGNGLLDGQQVGPDIDLDGDGTPDADQDGLLCVATSDTFNPYVGLKEVNGDAQIVALRALTLSGLDPESTPPLDMTGLISFKLHLKPGVTTASITVLFSEPAPEDAQWYKFIPDTGWQVYTDVVFSPDRKSMTIVLEDGGTGDLDGIRNGVIVDPSGLGYESALSGGTSTTHSDQTGCFVSSMVSHVESAKFRFLLLSPLVIGTAACGMMKRRLNSKG
jgi:hypothetical protein